MTRPVCRDVTVVIPTTGGDVLRGCLSSIAAGTTWPQELIVVDQGQRAEVAAWIAELRGSGLNARHLPSSQRGIAQATNRGLEQARTQFVAVTHDDCRVRLDWLARLAARLPDVGDGVLTGRVEPAGDGIVLTVKVADEPAVYHAPLLDADVLFPPNMGFPVRLLEQVGAFDEHGSLLTAGEDNDWAYRVLRAGIPVIYDPTITVGHLARFTPADLPSLYRRYAHGQGAFYGKHLRRGDRFIARRALRDLVRAPWLLLRGLATRNRELIAMGTGEVTGLPRGIFAGLRNDGRWAARS
jgi:glycosyltransferase involved in cell wall biosynthesis